MQDERAAVVRAGQLKVAYPPRERTTCLTMSSEEGARHFAASRLSSALRRSVPGDEEPPDVTALLELHVPTSLVAAAR